MHHHGVIISNACPKEEFIGRTILISNNNTCHKLEIFDGGVFAKNSTDPNCTSITMEYSIDSIVGTFDFIQGSQVYDKKYGEQQGWVSQFDSISLTESCYEKIQSTFTTLSLLPLPPPSRSS